MAGYPVTQLNSPNRGDAMTGTPRGIVVHTAVGTFEGTKSWQMNPDQRYADGSSVNTCSTWVIGKNPGEIAQMTDSATIAWCQRAGSKTWHSIEMAGRPSEPLTAWQIEAAAHLLAWHNATYGTPMVVANNESEFGLGHHSMDREWLGVEWGHDSCPGDLIVAQKPTIVARARALAPGTAATEGEDMTPEQDVMLKEVHSILTTGNRLGPNQTAGGGVPIAWEPRQFWELDGAVAEVLHAVQASQAALLAKVAELAAEDTEGSPAGGVTGEQLKQAFREVLIEGTGGTP